MKKLIFIFLLIPLLMVKSVYATCSFITSAQNSMPAPLSFTVPVLGTNTTVGTDAAIGTVIYRQSYIPTMDVTLNCTGSGPFSFVRSIASAPLPLSSYSVAPYAGAVYLTDVPGIGAAITNAGKTFPTTTAICTGSTTQCTYSRSLYPYDLVLIKIGTIAAGTIQGSRLPCVKQTMGQSGDQTNITTGCYSGSINIVSQTCNIADYSVNLGTDHDIKDFTSVGSTTDWVDASIRMTGCPVFYGSYAGSNRWSDTGSNSLSSPTGNRVDVNLAVATGLDGTNLKIDNTIAGAADGVAIQIASGSAASPVIRDLSSVSVGSIDGKNFSMTISPGSSGNVSIPMVARYIQTKSRVSPGLANGKVVFTVNYY